jgi:hypothetical protein
LAEEVTVSFEFYTLNEAGEPVGTDDVLAWAQWYRTHDRVLTRDKVGNEPGRASPGGAGAGGVSPPSQAVVSTVFLAVDHGFAWPPGSAPPLLYETMIFGGDYDQHQERYASRPEALAGHARIVGRLRAGLPPWEGD